MITKYNQFYTKFVAMQTNQILFNKFYQIPYSSFKDFLQDNCAAVSEERAHVCAYYYNNIAPPH